MAAAAALRAATRTMYGRLHLSEAARNHLVDVEQVDLAELCEMDNATIDGVVKSLRKPGGDQVGFAVSNRSCRLLKGAATLGRYRRDTSRTVTPQDITVPNIRRIKEWQKFLVDYKAPEKAEYVKGDWVKQNESVRAELNQTKGSGERTIGYTVRPSTDVTEDPDGDAQAWASAADEMEARAPILIPGTDEFDPVFKLDNAITWKVLYRIYKDTEVWPHIKSCQRKKDGRKAWRQIERHFLGDQFAKSQADEANRRLITSSYRQDGRNWDFNKYVTRHRECHNILDDLQEQGKHNGLAETTKVQYFLDNITSTQLQIAVGVCRAHPAWTFDECATFCADNLRGQKKYNDQGRVVASMETGGDADEDGIVPDMSVEDRYYKPNEFGTLTPE